MKGMIVDYKQLKPGTKTVMLLNRVFIPQKLALQLSTHSYYEAAKEYIKRFRVKTILVSVAGGDCKVDFPEDAITYMNIKGKGIKNNGK